MQRRGARFDAVGRPPDLHKRIGFGACYAVRANVRIPNSLYELLQCRLVARRAV